ncbi:hypothetical protein [Enterococcus gilvus]|uniref:hypothetical protein n=1 Tax=Enterococcus gilvus TaxID=160453 RepID=UPI001C8C8BDA|nr:hypothetical protein [Enterococcus gilvus]MBX8937754.1 hypothetical protein [Enterococcus gilvus]
MKSRDDFSQKTKDTLAKRVAYHCSNPDCMRQTVGPKQGTSDSALSLGQAAHITAASIGGPRFNSSMTREERKSIHNGLWLCCSCATLIDRDEQYYTAELLNAWKVLAEKNASDAITKPILNHIEKNKKQFSYKKENSLYMSLDLDEKLSEFKRIMKRNNLAFSLEGPENYAVSHGFLTLNNNKRPHEEIEIRKFKLLRYERLDIFGRYFQVIISITDGVPDNFLFTFDINFNDVKRRLTGFENLLPILESKKLTFSIPDYKDAIPIQTANMPEWENQLLQSRGSIKLMENIIDIQEHFGITFNLPHPAETGTVEKIDIIYNSIIGKECLNLSGIPDELIDSEDRKPNVIEKTLLTPENNFTETIELLNYRFIPVDYYILPGMMDFNQTTQLWEINNSGVPVTCTFKCEQISVS